MAVADVVRTTLGPRGMDKLMVNTGQGSSTGGVTISNDGATIMKMLDIVHPAAKTLVDISLSQDAEVGDGTTTVVILAAEFLKQVKPFLEEGVHPRLVMKSIREAMCALVGYCSSSILGRSKTSTSERWDSSCLSWRTSERANERTSEAQARVRGVGGAGGRSVEFIPS